jgi:hypothetical protein
MAQARRTPDMSRPAAAIDDPLLLYARIGYRTFLKYRDGARSPEALYDGYNEAELKRLLALHPRQLAGAGADPLA